MTCDEWLAYFESNENRPAPQTPSHVASLAPELHRPLVTALQCFQLGEAGEGRVAKEAACSLDPALNHSMKESVRLYVREEGRHARELSKLLSAMGEPVIRKHRFDRWFRWSRRFFGLRPKMAVIAAAEVVGSTFYWVVATRVPCSHVAEVARAIGGDEDRHLEFQRYYFKRVLLMAAPIVRPMLALVLGTWFLVVLLGAIASVSIGHRKLFLALDVRPLQFAFLCVQRLRRLSTRPASIDSTGAELVT